MLYLYSVTPLKEDHFEERCADIVELIQNGVITMPLFSMTLVPEGNPVWDKVTPMAELFARYREALKKYDIPAGILVQASLGHGYEIEPNPFERYVNFVDGTSRWVCCPEDEAFLSHFCDVLKKLAKEHPSAIMLDDDFRLLVRPGRGCTCSLHMKEFNRRSGLQMSREELREYILTHDSRDPLTKIYTDTQRDSLIHAARRFRDAIDEIDPSIQGINCTCGHFCETVTETNPIFAGKGNPTMVRVPNGIYAPLTVRGISDLMRQGAICASKLKKHGIEIILAETDTLPYNRYGKSARFLHSQMVGSLLEGLKGAKHWLSRSTAFEPASGKAYREILAKHRGMYDALAQLSDEIRWVGCGSAFLEQDHFVFDNENFRRYHDNDWVTSNLERMGLPFYFSELSEEAENGQRATFLEGDIVSDMTDGQIQALVQGSLLVDGESAKALCERGFGDLLGVTVKPWQGERVSGECFDSDGICTCTKQKNLYELNISGTHTEASSYNFVRQSNGVRLLSPAVTIHRREEGVSVVFCGSPKAKFHYTEGFSFLNESRKAQLVSLLKEANALPIYCVGDDEICLRAGYLTDGTLLAAAFLLGADPMEELPLYLESAPASIARMEADGSVREVEWRARGEDIYSICVRVELLEPVILLIRFEKNL